MPRVRERQLHNLPVPRTRLIGRERDAAAVRQVLLSVDGRLVTLTGTGGCGKTRLALAVAADLLISFVNGVWLVELAPLADPILIPQVVATALGIREQPTRSILDTLVAQLKTRQLLIVLDNCEHLVDACAQLADVMLGGCPDVRLLATSREPLGTQGELTWRVPSLAFPNLHKGPALGELAGSPAVQFFVDRAQAVQPAFMLTADNAPTVGQICQRLDGLPLAIELAAARLRGLGVEQILERLDTSIRLLVGGSRTAPDRQQTLKATLDWSRALLTLQEQVAFRRLAVFAGGWSMEAAETVCAGGEVEGAAVVDLMSRLVEKSLVLMEERDGRARYRLLEPVRQYAMEQLQASGELAAVQERHVAYFLEFAEEWAGWAHRDRAVQLLKLEQDNQRAALRWCVDHSAADTGLRIARGWMFLWGAGWSKNQEASAWLRQLLALPGAEQPTVASAAALGCSGNLAMLRGDLAAARVFHVQGLATARAVGDAHQLFSNLMDIGIGAEASGDHANARRHIQEAVVTARTAGLRVCEAIGLSFLGVLAEEQSNFEEARALAEEGWGLARAEGEQGWAGSALGILGGAALGLGELANARRLLEEGLALDRQTENESWMMGRTLDRLGWLALTQGQHAEAQARFAESLTRFQDLGEVMPIADSLEGLAALAAARGEHERALRLVGAATAVRERVGAPLHPIRRTRRDRWLDPLRQVVGEPTVEQAWASGQALTLDQAVTLALEETEPAPPGSAHSGAVTPTQAGPLTTREREVAALLARGLSNRQIAEQLVITERTVAAHVEHILDKLDFSSRTQIALWAAAEHNLRAPDPA
jgi:predicted ATPase/DNA-binding CsgD family transcriptional regulator